MEKINLRDFSLLKKGKLQDFELNFLFPILLKINNKKFLNIFSLLYTLFNPVFWIMNNPKSKDYDKYIEEAIDNEQEIIFEKFNEYSKFFSDMKFKDGLYRRIWLRNYPYSFGSVKNGIEEFRPSRKNIFKLRYHLYLEEYKMNTGEKPINDNVLNNYMLNGKDISNTNVNFIKKISLMLLINKDNFKILQNCEKKFLLKLITKSDNIDRFKLSMLSKVDKKDILVFLEEHINEKRKKMGYY